AGGVRVCAGVSARASPSASTGSPKGSSKGTAARAGSCCWACHAAAKASRRRALSFSRVGWVSITSPLSVVVVAAPDVLVLEGGARGGGGGRAIEAAAQDRIDMPIRARAGGERSRTRGFQPPPVGALGEPHEA